MSEIKTSSPLLDEFTIGNPMSEHDGVRCCPAIKENTDKKYIIKIISVPASQVQMDALLLAGAYKDPADAMDYFRQTGEGVLQEAELLKKLSRLDGFLPYEFWEMQPITRHRLGYEIYLAGSYKRSLEKYLKQHPVTHLEAMNLSLDLCAALDLCRKAGALYVDLKPANIFVSEKKEYRIGDLGFLQMEDLRFLALPEKYHSPYTPPELLDPMANVNLTVDTYAVGMILYQLYNDGQLPFKGLRLTDAELLTPVNADYEMAEIIMKAIHLDPEQRWASPAELGKALASYMQRNSVNDVPITPHIPLDVKPEDIVVLADQKDVPEDSEVLLENTEEEPETAEITESDVQTPAEETEPADEEVSAETESEEAAEAVPEAAIKEVPEEEPETEEAPDDTPQEIPEVFAEFQVSAVPEDAPAESEKAAEQLSEDVSRILAKADDLIAHETPEGIVIPEAPDPFAFIEEDSDEIDDSDIPLDPVMDDEAPAAEPKKKKKEQKFADPKYKKRKKRMIATVLFLLLLGAEGTGGFWYYQNLYLQTIRSLEIESSQDELHVSVDTDLDESLLTVLCSDSYGNSLSHGLTDGKAVFKDLLPNTMYKIQLEVDGFHALVGQTSDVFTTDATTKIASFTYVAGAEDGSVMLNFTVDGEEPDSWTVYYSAEGEDPLRKTFSGHSVTVSDLTVGKQYTFTLETNDNLSLNGQTSLVLTASRLILAEDLRISTDSGTDIIVNWSAPGDVVVDSWEVRCYNNAGYDETLYVSDTQAAFPSMDPTFSYTIEVTAAGMTQPARTTLTQHPITIQELQVDSHAADKLKVNWKYTGDFPEGGWLLMYTVDGGEKYVVKSDKPTATITPKIPGGKYSFTIQAANGTSIFNNTVDYAVEDAAPYDKNALKADQLQVDLVRTPEEEQWTFESLGSDAIQDTFSIGDSISIVMRCEESFYLPGSLTDILYVIRDAYGNVLPDYVSQETISWKKIWTGGEVKNGELTIPTVPAYQGAYVLHLYFDGLAVAELPFTIVP